MRPQTRFVLIVGSVYATLALLGAFHHELWLDEAQHWLLARDSHTFSELLANTRHEGHPLLWSWILYVISRFTANPMAMQIVHVGIAIATVVLFLLKAPFGKVFKILFVFGYFMFFEYCLISRNYMLGIFFLMLACAYIGRRQSHFVHICAALVLAANVHLLFAVPASALFLLLCLEQFEQKQWGSKPSYLMGYGLFLLGLLGLGWQIFRTDATWFFSSLQAVPLHEKLTKGFAFFYKGVLVFPDFSTLHFWNTNRMVNVSKPIAAVFALLVYALPLALYRSKKTLAFVYLALFGAQIFFWVTQRGATRFDGLGYLIVIMGLWMDGYFRQDERPPHFYWMKDTAIYGMLGLHLLAGVMAFATDWNHPFTGARDAVRYINTRFAEQLPVVSVSCDGSIVSAYLGTKVWFLCRQQYKSFCDWDSDFDCAQNISPQRIIALLEPVIQKHGAVIYVSNFNLEPLPSSPFTIETLEKFNNNIVRNSNYYIFKITKK